jgi:H+/Cl- antiporter ClcA
MTAQDYATLTVAVMTIVGGFVAGVRWLVKHYLNELKPNGGSSVKDKVDSIDRQVIKLESRIDQIYLLLINK